MYRLKAVLQLLSAVKVPKAGTLPYLTVFLIQLSNSSSFRDIRGSQIYIRGPCAPWTPPSGKVFVPKASTLPHLKAESLYCNYFWSRKNQSFRNKSGIAQPIRTKFGIAIRGQVKGDNVQGILGAISPFWAKWGALKMQDKTLQDRTMTDKRSTMPE